ncbi:hypothetical protein BURKHO8Y_340015 [Burkholderia sp. 8Y]|nr:hypothetical protein BURKHO8Y_340015 [Burkholderia sp. 8Y]
MRGFLCWAAATNCQIAQISWVATYDAQNQSSLRGHDDALTPSCGQNGRMVGLSLQGTLESKN